MQPEWVEIISWNDWGEVIVVDSINEAYALADEYASEHVQVMTHRPREVLAHMKNYSTLFLGENTCVAYGDKVSLKLERISPGD